MGDWLDTIPELTKVTMTLETDEGVVATIVCEPDQSFGSPHGHPRIRIGREDVDPRFSVLRYDRVAYGNNPVVEIAAGRVTIEARGS